MTDPYDWHKRALGGEKPPIHSEPECGWFLYKSPHGMIPASIYWEACPVDDDGEIIGDEVLRCEIGGEYRDPEEYWLHLAKRPITKEEYEQRQLEAF